MIFFLHLFLVLLFCFTNGIFDYLLQIFFFLSLDTLTCLNVSPTMFSWRFELSIFFLLLSIYFLKIRTVLFISVFNNFNFRFKFLFVAKFRAEIENNKEIEMMQKRNNIIESFFLYFQKKIDVKYSYFIINSMKTWNVELIFGFHIVKLLFCQKN